MRGREILDMMKRHDIRVVHAPEDRILEARALLARRGIYCEHTTAANYAAWGRYCELYGPTPDTLITMCGAGPMALALFCLRELRDGKLASEPAELVMHDTSARAARDTTHVVGYAGVHIFA